MHGENENNCKIETKQTTKVDTEASPNSPSEIVLLFFGRGIIAVEVDRLTGIAPSRIIVHVLNTPWGRVLEGTVILVIIMEWRYGRHDPKCELPAVRPSHACDVTDREQ